ncbi:MAG: hypothetical protein RIE24_05370 [Silicimonas sp.]|jgi:hypothetical protein|uniref:hypothetical protein n=1 Tax=Alphaproteobacteria TaxID=28211 RepID=UPI0032EBBB2B
MDLLLFLLITGAIFIWILRRTASVRVTGNVAYNPVPRSATDALYEDVKKRQWKALARLRQREAQVQHCADEITSARSKLAERLTQSLRDDQREHTKHQRAFAMAWNQFLSVMDARYGGSIVDAALQRCSLSREA